MESDSEPKSKLISLIYQLATLQPVSDMDSKSGTDWDSDTKLISVTIQIISLVNSMDMTKPESELMSLVTQIISVFNSMDMDSQEKPLLELISFIKQTTALFKSLNLYSEPKPLLKLKSLITQQDTLLKNPLYSNWEFIAPFDHTLNLRLEGDQDLTLMLLASKTWDLEPESELMSLIHHILSLVTFMNPKWKKLICLSPQGDTLGQCDDNKWWCLPGNWQIFRFGKTREDDTHFFCYSCKGKNHQEEYEQALVEIKHPLHPKHRLQLVMKSDERMECYCCDENLTPFFYHCSPCHFAINITCIEKPPVLSIDHPKWHEHTLVLFSRTTSLTCDVCGLASSNCAFYICSPCGFVVHRKCLSLPRVIRISRHIHRISFTSSFDQGGMSCGVCRRKINNDYGRYSCFKDGCSYAAHSKCATQRNIWDGKELEGEPEEIEEEVLEPFVRISDGIIQHFSHQQHHLILDEDTSRDYDDNKLCQACIPPVYFGNFYSCMQCDYILHETCAQISRRIHHPIHPHMLTLLVEYDGVKDYLEDRCSACSWMCKFGFFYECGEEGCCFKVHVQCGIISEPLVHESHMHPLFLTSKLGERRECGVCYDPNRCNTNETFNCIDCDFSLCFACATLPQKVRYRHDKHMLTLSYGYEGHTMTYWCEACEGKINPRKRFYMCDEYCCVTLHIKCLIGKNFHLKPGSSYNHHGTKVCIVANNHHMSRPICSFCDRRCLYKIVLQFSGMIFCSLDCTFYHIRTNHKARKDNSMVIVPV